MMKKWSSQLTRTRNIFNAGSKKRMETERSYQNKLGANRYAAFSDDNDDNWNTHVTVCRERREAWKNERD